MAGVLQPKKGVCPVVGTTNIVLPPTHPEFKQDVPGQTCPVTNATTGAHKDVVHFINHPGLPVYAAGSDPMDAAQCPALKKVISKPEEVKMDEEICPVVGSVSRVLPPDHPKLDGNLEKQECPRTKATLSSHKNKNLMVHPQVENSAGVCPVVGRVGEVNA